MSAGLVDAFEDARNMGDLIATDDTVRELIAPIPFLVHAESEQVFCIQQQLVFNASVLVLAQARAVLAREAAVAEEARRREAECRANGGARWVLVEQDEDFDPELEIPHYFAGVTGVSHFSDSHVRRTLGAAQLVSDDAPIQGVLGAWGRYCAAVAEAIEDGMALTEALNTVWATSEAPAAPLPTSRPPEP